MPASEETTEEYQKLVKNAMNHFFFLQSNMKYESIRAAVC